MPNNNRNKRKSSRKRKKGRKQYHVDYIKNGLRLKIGGHVFKRLSRNTRGKYLYKCPFNAQCPPIQGQNVYYHAQRCQDLREYPCRICAAGRPVSIWRFNTKKDLLQHIRAKHGQPIRCDICGASFTRKSSLQRHLNTVHNEKKRQNNKRICRQHNNDDSNDDDDNDGTSEIFSDPNLTDDTYVNGGNTCEIADINDQGEIADNTQGDTDDDDGEVADNIAGNKNNINDGEVADNNDANDGEVADNTDDNDGEVADNNDDNNIDHGEVADTNDNRNDNKKKKKSFSTTRSRRRRTRRKKNDKIKTTKKKTKERGTVTASIRPGLRRSERVAAQKRRETATCGFVDLTAENLKCVNFGSVYKFGMQNESDDESIFGIVHGVQQSNIIVEVLQNDDKNVETMQMNLSELSFCQECTSKTTETVKSKINAIKQQQISHKSKQLTTKKRKN